MQGRYAHFETPTRRAFLGRSLGAAGLLAALPAWAAPLRGADAAPVLVNHVGFPPHAAKVCLRAGTKRVAFSVVDRAAGRSVRDGVMNPCTGDLGSYVVGDFSDLTRPGEYEIRAEGARSGPFTVGDGVYTPAVRQCVSYFARQRCGDSRSGHHAPCHLDDGRRPDNAKLLDVSGGWHDACDLRKWVNATVYGMTGLSRVLDVLGPGRVDRGQVVDELRWGNGYFRKMQDPAGFVMNYCGGDDGNHYTDNKPGTADDRPVHVEPCDLPGQFHFIAAQAALARHTRGADPAYARGCEAAAGRCLTWCIEKRSPGASNSLGAAVLACAEMHRTTGGRRYRDLAAGYAKRLLALQVMGERGANAAGTSATQLRGFFLAAVDRPEPAREIMHGNLPLLALCEILDRFADHPDTPAWRAALELHAEYLLAMSGRSAFGTMPFGLYSGTDPGGGRRAGSYWYRWFMRPHGETAAADWWVGINAHLASHGVGMVKAARLLRDARLGRLAQRQLDWVLGANPFDASTVNGAGRNQPPLFVTGEFEPATPVIPGGVMNGIGGSAHDEPDIGPGSYHTCEYWTPVVAYTMWLMAELEAAGRA